MFDPGTDWTGYWERINKSLGLEVGPEDPMFESMLKTLVVLANKVQKLEERLRLKDIQDNMHK